MYTTLSSARDELKISNRLQTSKAPSISIDLRLQAAVGLIPLIRRGKEVMRPSITQDYCRVGATCRTGYEPILGDYRQDNRQKTVSCDCYKVYIHRYTYFQHLRPLGGTLRRSP
jgi:hypothetical protein